METEKVLNEKIVSLTMLIKDKYPELAGFLEEMPETIPDEKNPHINIKTLTDYYNSLEALIKKYAIEHPT